MRQPTNLSVAASYFAFQRQLLGQFHQQGLLMRRKGAQPQYPFRLIIRQRQRQIRTLSGSASRRHDFAPRRLGRAIAQPMRRYLKPLGQSLHLIRAGARFSGQPLLGGLGRDGIVGMAQAELNCQLRRRRNRLRTALKRRPEAPGKRKFLIDRHELNSGYAGCRVRTVGCLQQPYGLYSPAVAQKNRVRITKGGNR